MHRYPRGILAMLLVVLSLGSILMPAARALNETRAAQLQAALTLAEQDYDNSVQAIRLLVSQCCDGLEESDPLRATLQSVLLLLDSGGATAESIALLLRTAIDSPGNPDAAPATAPASTPGAAGAATERATADAVLQNQPPQQAVSIGTQLPETGELNLPPYEVDDFTRAILQDAVLVDVPYSWGNNASGRAMTSYSPVNDSGAISPSAGTLTLSYFPREGQSDTAAFDTYTNNIAEMSVTTSLSYEDLPSAALPARKIDFTMSVGANQFACETVCFSYADSVYAIELMQGGQAQYDYFPVYHRVVNSAEIGTAASLEAARAEIENRAQGSGTATLPRESGQPRELMPPQESVPPPEDITEDMEAGDTQPESAAFSGDMSSFEYEINGHVYTFPTAIRELEEGDLPLQLDMNVPYDLNSDADMAEGEWTEIVNTQYYYFENSLHKEMAGVTNMSGYPTPVLDCTLTALIDTQGDYVGVSLPGGIRVGGRESDILRGFPLFEGKALDGYADFIGNELLYACNVRDDGCNGYVLIRNDDPFYSAVSIICQDGVIREISFECLGSVRARGVFL